MVGERGKEGRIPALGCLTPWEARPFAPSHSAHLTDLHVLRVTQVWGWLAVQEEARINDLGWAGCLFLQAAWDSSNSRRNGAWEQLWLWGPLSQPHPRPEGAACWAGGRGLHLGLCRAGAAWTASGVGEKGPCIWRHRCHVQRAPSATCV